MDITELTEFFKNNFISYTLDDIQNVKDVIYDDAWHSHEESSGLFIYRSLDHNLYYVEYRSFCFTPKDHFTPVLISDDEAVIKMLEKDEEINDFYEPKKTDSDNDDFPFY